MTEKIRMILLLVCFLGIGYVIYGVVDEKLTEKLDDITIHKIYAMGDTLFNNPQGMKDFLEKRLSESYVKTGSTTFSMKGKPDQTTPMQFNKAQTIDMVVRGMSTMKLTKYKHDIAQVQLSEDNQYAYVSSTEVAEGTIDFPLPDNRKITIPMNSASSCVDTLTREKKSLSLVRTSCKYVIGIQQ